MNLAEVSSIMPATQDVWDITENGRSLYSGRV